MAVDYNKTIRFGAGLGVVTYLLTQAVGFFVKNAGDSQATLSFIPTLTEGVKQNVQSGINTDIASQLLAFLSGINPFNIMGLITIVVAGIILAVVGAFIVHYY